MVKVFVFTYFFWIFLIVVFQFIDVRRAINVHAFQALLDEDARVS